MSVAVDTSQCLRYSTGFPADTADRIWAELDLGIEIGAIR